MTVRIGVVHRPNPSMGQDDYSSVAVRRVGICAGMARVAETLRLSNEEVNANRESTGFSTIPDYSRVVTKFVLRWCD